VAGLAFYYIWDGKKQDLSGPLAETYRLDPHTLFLQRVVSPKAVHLLDCSLYKYLRIRTPLFGTTILDVEPVFDAFFNHLDGIGGQKQSTTVTETTTSTKPNKTSLPGTVARIWHQI